MYHSTVVLWIAMGGPALHKEILVFTFSFNLNLSSKDIKMENMQKSNCMQKVNENVT